MQKKHSLRKRLAIWFAVISIISAAVAMVAKYDLRFYRVETVSMEPVLPVGTFVLIAKADDYRKYDIISFMRDDNVLTTHALYSTNRDGTLKTIGVANGSSFDTFDRPPTIQDVKGRVVFQFDILTSVFWFGPRGVIVVMAVTLLFLLWMAPTAPKKSVAMEPTEESVPIPA